MRKIFRKQKGGRPSRPSTKEMIDLRLPFDLLDQAEDLSHQAYLSRTDILVQAVRLGLPLVCEQMGLTWDRPDKVTYKNRLDIEKKG